MGVGCTPLKFIFVKVFYHSPTINDMQMKQYVFLSFVLLIQLRYVVCSVQPVFHIIGMARHET